MQNYYNYFTEVEERFQQRRGSLLLLSTLDWSLIEVWRDAGVPLEAVLRGIDDAFEKQHARQAKGRTRRVNGLAWCAQAVMEAAEQMREAATGAAAPQEQASGFEGEAIARHLADVRQQLLASADSSAAMALPPAASELARQTAARLAELEVEVRAAKPNVEALELTLRTLEEKLLSMVLATLPEDALSALRAQAERELAPYRSRMQALQIRQIQQQFLEKRLLERFSLPRLSLFYMRSDG